MMPEEFKNNLQELKINIKLKRKEAKKLLAKLISVFCVDSIPEAEKLLNTIQGEIDRLKIEEAELLNLIKRKLNKVESNSED